jgi:hypothetical protein
LRYPEKFILMALFAVLVFGSRALDELLVECGGSASAFESRVEQRRPSLRTTVVRVAAALTVIFAIAVVVSRTPLYPPLFAWLWHPRASRFAPMLAASATGWLLALARSGAVLLLVRNVANTRRATWLAIAGVFAVLDLGMLFPEAVPRMPAEYYDAPAMAKLLPQNRTPWRLFHHASWHTRRDAAQAYRVASANRMWINRNAMYPLIPAQYGIRMALDVDYDLTSLTPTADFVQSASELSGLRRDWVDVIASMSNVWYRAVFRDPREAFAKAHGDLRVLQPVGLLPMPHYPRYYFAERLEPITDRNDFVRKAGSTQYPKGTAFIPPPTVNRQPSTGIVTHVHETTNTATIDVTTAGPAFLVISVTPHKYWTITIDGRETNAIPTNIGYQGVIVPTAGKHTIAMRYRNPLFAAGGAISAAALLLLALLARRA